MAEIKWIKLTTNMFDNRKIKHLRKLPEGNSIVLIWVMLLTMAGRCNANGMIFLTENIPYTTKMLADELDFEENVVKMALVALEQFDMIVMTEGFLSIAGWEEHQNIEGMDKIREQGRIRKQKQRERQKQALLESKMSRDVTGHVTQCHATESDIEEEKEIEIDKENKRIDYQSIVNSFNSICVSFPSVKSISEARKKAIKARLNTYSMDDFVALFKKAEASDFLKGQNDRNWTATFDWLIKDANMAKVLEGQYENRPKKPTAGKKNSFHNYEQRSYDYEAMQRMLNAKQSKTAGEDPAVKARAEALRKELGGV